jgi:hypothetical protein
MLIYHEPAGTVDSTRGRRGVRNRVAGRTDAIPRRNEMNVSCHCGLSPERPGPNACLECETVTCPSCAITVATDTYCRWCAPALAHAA